MPYLPFPATWPVFCPAKKLANWLESYASILELPVWLSANATKVYHQEGLDAWCIDVDVKGKKKTLKANHVVFAIGLGSGSTFVPDYPGVVSGFTFRSGIKKLKKAQGEFSGKILHSSTHKTPQVHIGKKVAVIGSSTSSHDVCADLAKHGIGMSIFFHMKNG
jgi:cation diffusion facilitator CzcD-associated flavoprotein CzcO